MSDFSGFDVVNAPKSYPVIERLEGVVGLYVLTDMRIKEKMKNNYAESSIESPDFSVTYTFLNAFLTIPLRCLILFHMTTTRIESGVTLYIYCNAAITSGFVALVCTKKVYTFIFSICQNAFSVTIGAHNNW